MKKMELFKKYKCKAYMKQGGNGARMETRPVDGMPIEEAQVVLGTYYENGELKTKDLSECCGETIPKTYYERVEKEFEGFLVGTKKITVSGIIGTDTEQDEYAGERKFFFKETINAPMVGIVYFRNNGKRYVMLEDMELIDE